MENTRAKVLVVSPDIELQESVTSVLLRAGFALDQAGGVEEAHKACTQRRAPDVLLVDGTQAWPGLMKLLDDPPRPETDRAPMILLLAGPRTGDALRTHRSVGDVVDAPTPHAVTTLVALRRRLGAPSAPMGGPGSRKALARKRRRDTLRAS